MNPRRDKKIIGLILLATVVFSVTPALINAGWYTDTKTKVVSHVLWVNFGSYTPLQIYTKYYADSMGGVSLDFNHKYSSTDHYDYGLDEGDYTNAYNPGGVSTTVYARTVSSRTSATLKIYHYTN